MTLALLFAIHKSCIVLAISAFPQLLTAITGTSVSSRLFRRHSPHASILTILVSSMYGGQRNGIDSSPCPHVQLGVAFEVAFPARQEWEGHALCLERSIRGFLVALNAQSLH